MKQRTSDAYIIFARGSYDATYKVFATARTQTGAQRQKRVAVAIYGTTRPVVAVKITCNREAQVMVREI